jgi:hypothetical protein
MAGRKEAGEEIVDGNGGSEFLQVGGEGGGCFGGLLLIPWQLGVAGTLGGIECRGVGAERLPLGKRWAQRAELLMKLELAIC